MRSRNGAYRRWTWRSLLRAPIPQIVVGAMLLCTLYAVATSRLFSVTTVQAVDQPNLQNLLQQKCGCIGANIFLTRTDDIRARLARIPWIDVHNVYAHLPNRIVIEAAYRPVAALWRTDAAVYAVDDTGQVLYDVGAPPPEVTEVPMTARCLSGRPIRGSADGAPPSPWCAKRAPIWTRPSRRRSTTIVGARVPG